MSTYIVPTVPVSVQTACQELGEQPAIKFRFRSGQLTAIVNVPVCSQDDDETRQRKIDTVLAGFRKDLEVVHGIRRP